jgi:hypothetical protein
MGDNTHPLGAHKRCSKLSRTKHAIARQRPEFELPINSQVMTLTPGDVISTGTPGATPIQDGDEVECRIDGFEPLKNPVIDLKRGGAR